MINTQLMSVFHPNKTQNHIYCTDKNHRLMSCNDWQAIDVGLPCEAAVVGKSLWDIHTDKEATLFALNNEDVIKTGIAKTCLESATFNGIQVIYTTHKSPLKNEKGRVIGVMGMSVAINDTPTLKLQSLSAQQSKCFQLLLKGYTLKQIALELHLTTRTVEHYASHIRKKLQCKNIKELIVRYANQFQFKVN